MDIQEYDRARRDLEYVISSTNIHHQENHRSRKRIKAIETILRESENVPSHDDVLAQDDGKAGNEANEFPLMEIGRIHAEIGWTPACQQAIICKERENGCILS